MSSDRGCTPPVARCAWKTCQPSSHIRHSSTPGDTPAQSDLYASPTSNHQRENEIEDVKRQSPALGTCLQEPRGTQHRAERMWAWEVGRKGGHQDHCRSWLQCDPSKIAGAPRPTSQVRKRGSERVGHRDSGTQGVWVTDSRTQGQWDSGRGAQEVCRSAQNQKQTSSVGWIQEKSRPGSSYSDSP
jgi:hypothetical protein